ncbi:hypothetical protein X756_12910 [Mesorhizobium sp. LSHC412B00]|nr:hypothetical protein X756_12910 [Mesorhizobium sp. LSHC412B00]
MILGLPSVTAMPAKNSFVAESSRGISPSFASTGAVHILKAR